MTEERYTPGSGDETDALVSARYRELARERAPEHLDRAVLKEAARAARPRYSKLRSWTRPLAWAATVVLSVVLVLEISQLPAPDEAVFDVPTSDPALPRQEAAGFLPRRATRPVRASARHRHPSPSETPPAGAPASTCPIRQYLRT